MTSKQDETKSELDLNNTVTEKSKSKSLKDIQVPNHIAAIIIIAMLAVCYFGYSFIYKNQDDGAINAGTQIEDNSVGDEDAVSVEVLPKVERNFGSDGKNPFVSEDLSDVLLTGILTSTNISIAILETPTSSYIVKEGENVNGTSWVLESIDENSVTLSKADSKKIITIEP